MQELLHPNPIEREKLKQGDHIFAYRRGTPCHGIYDGQGKVIHFISSPQDQFNSFRCTNCGDSEDYGVVTNCLRCFLTVDAKTSDLYRFQYAARLAIFLARKDGGTCALARADPPNVVMHRARYLLQNAVEANSVNLWYFVSSPEDFAVYCSTGLLALTGSSKCERSPLVLTALATVASPPLRALLGFAGMAFLGVSTHCITRLADDIGIRHYFKDAISVSLEDLFLFAGILPSISESTARSILPL